MAERKSKIVITGATGFLGKRTAVLLRERGYEVVGLGRNRILGKTLEENGIQFIECDLSDRAKLDNAFADADFVVHSAALASPWGPWREFVSSNITGTQNVVESCRKSKNCFKRLIHISSPAIYMNLKDRANVRETEELPKKQVGYYAKSKRLSEEVVQEACREGANSVSSIILRPQGIFGPGDTTILPRLIRIAEKGVLPLIGNGENQIDMTYVDNVVDSILLAIEAPDRCNGRSYNITNGEPVRNYEVLLHVLKELGYPVRLKKMPAAVAMGLAGAMEAFHSVFLPTQEPLLTRYSVCLLSRTRTLNIDRARQELGYNPRISMEEGLRRYLAWWKEKTVDTLSSARAGK